MKKRKKISFDDKKYLLFTEELASKSGKSVKSTQSFYQILVDMIVEKLNTEDEIFLPYIGTLKRSMHKGHKVTITRDGESKIKDIDDYVMLKYVASKDLKEKVTE